MSFLKHPCKICINDVKDNDPAVLCDLCEKWVHTACIGIQETQYESLKRRHLPWYCPYCITEFPFSSVNNKDLHSLALSSGPTNINNHASPTVKKINKKKKRIPENVSRNESNI